MKKLNVEPSFLMNHVTLYGAAYRDQLFGPERTAFMDPAGACLKEQVRFTLHTDSPCSPIGTLGLVQTAVTRVCEFDNTVIGADQAVTVQQALEAVTIDAARQLGLVDRLARLESGKEADFTILEDNPLTVDPSKIGAIRSARPGLPVKRSSAEGVARVDHQAFHAPRRSCILAPSSALADDTQDLAKKLSNPVADLISVPLQGNYNQGIGPERMAARLRQRSAGHSLHLNEDWNVISRTILPVISQDDIFPGAGSQFGLGNTQQSLFFSPVKPTHGIIWGLGPIFYLPTATDDLLGPDKWGAGPTGVALMQSGPWTVGVLANQIWSFAGAADEKDINQSYMQPFLSYTTKDAWTFSLNTESTMTGSLTTGPVPVNAMVSKLVHVGKQPSVRGRGPLLGGFTGG